MLISPDVNPFAATAKIAQAERLTLDLETTGIHPFTGDTIAGVAIGVDGECWYFPFGHEDVLDNLRPIFFKDLIRTINAKPRTIVGFNLKFELNFLFAAGYPLSHYHTYLDAQILCHLTNENELSMAMKELSVKYVDKNADKSESDLFYALERAGYVKGRGKNARPDKGQMWRLPAAVVEPYACMDVVLPELLINARIGALEAENNIDIWEESNEYMQALHRMEAAGALIDQGQVDKQWAESARRRKELEQQMYRLVGKEFNPASYPQVGAIIGQKETSKEALKDCKHPLVPLLLEWRGWNRAITAYYEPFTTKKDHKGRIHPNFNQCTVITSRLSCTDPNLQAVPKENDTYAVRQTIVAPPGKVILSFDYSQIELRMLAHYTRDPFLLRAYRENLDIHQETADLLHIKRDDAKRINFGIVYGLGAESASAKLNISYNEAQQLLNRYHKRIPGIKQIYSKSESYARRHRNIPLWTGRRRHYKPYDEFQKALSNLIQGGVGEIVRIAITTLDKEVIRKYPEVEMFLQVHDDIVFYVPEGLVAEIAPKVQHIMENVEVFNVPIIAEGKVGKNWGKMQKLEEYLASAKVAILSS